MRRRIQDRILQVARAKYPQFEFLPFSGRAVARNPLLMVGTFTPVNYPAPGQFRHPFIWRRNVAGVLKANTLVHWKIERPECLPLNATRTTAFDRTQTLRGSLELLASVDDR
jgi:hypothetical protein